MAMTLPSTFAEGTVWQEVERSNPDALNVLRRLADEPQFDRLWHWIGCPPLSASSLSHSFSHTQLTCGAVRCGAVRCGAVRCGAVRCGAVRCGAVRCGAMPLYRFVCVCGMLC